MSTTLLFLLTVFLLVATSVFGLPSTTYSAQDKTRTVQRLTQRQGKDGLFGDLAETYASVGALKALEADIPRAKELCEKLATALTAGAENKNDVENIFYAVHAAVAAKCGNVRLAAEQKEALQKALKSEHLVPAYHATTTVLKLVENKSARLEDFDFSAVAGNLLSLVEDDGTFRSSRKSKQGSPLHAGMALEALGRIYSTVSNLPNDTKDEIRGVGAQVEKLLELGGDDKNRVSFAPTQGRSPISSTAHVLVGLHTFGTAISGNLGITESHVGRFATFFIENKFVQNPIDVYHLLTALKIFGKGLFTTPLVLTVEGNQVRVTDLFGKYAAAVSVTLKKAVSEKDTSKVLVQDLTLKPASTGKENTVFELNAPALAHPDFYILVFSVEPQSKEGDIKPQTITYRHKITGQIKSAQLRLLVTKDAEGNDALESDTKTATYPNSFSGPLQAGSQQYIHARVKLSGDVEPAQVFIELVDSFGQRAAFPAKKNKQEYEASLELEAPSVQNSLYGSGDYSVNVLIGDAFISTPISWKAGAVQLALKKSGGKVAESTGYLREIAYAFREDERRPNIIISLFFTGVAVVPFGFLFYGLTKLGGFNLRLPSAPSHFLFAVIFQISIATILGCFILYWLFLNIFQALGLLIVLGIVAVFSGQRALRAHNIEQHPKSD